MRPKAECEDGAASGWGHSRACPEFVEGLPLKLSPYFFVKSPLDGFGGMVGVREEFEEIFFGNFQSGGVGVGVK